MLILRKCNFCKNEYQADERYLKRGQGKYCSRSCSSKDPENHPKRKVNLITLNCAFCNEKFERPYKKHVSSKSGLFFCCRLHKDLAQRIGGIEAIQPKHYSKLGLEYREIAKRNFEEKCLECNYSKIPEILEVHHKDHNRLNNSKENLCFLCPNCHQEHHFKTKSGRYSKTK